MDEEKYRKEVKRWKRRISVILIVMPIVFIFGIVDTLYFKNTGKSVIHPYLDMLLVMCAFGLFVVAAAARLRWYWMKNDFYFEGRLFLDNLMAI